MIISISKGQQITIPANIREALGLTIGSKVEIEEENGKIILKPIEEDLENTRKKIIEIAIKIRQKSTDDSFIANPVYFGREPACVYCAYNQICPFSLVKA